MRGVFDVSSGMELEFKLTRFTSWDDWWVNLVITPGICLNTLPLTTLEANLLYIQIFCPMQGSQWGGMWTHEEDYEMVKQ